MRYRYERFTDQLLRQPGSSEEGIRNLSARHLARSEKVEKALGAGRGVLEVLSLGGRLDLVKQVGSPAQLEATYGVSTWRGP